MYDTLWIGCSHSSGLYDYKNRIIDSRCGIASRIADHYKQSWKILSFPGDGNHTFMEIVKTLDDLDELKKFKNIIVQQTYEPRLNFYEQAAHQDRMTAVIDFIQSDNHEKNDVLNAAICGHDKKVFSLIARELFTQHGWKFTKENINFIDVIRHIVDNIDPRNSSLPHGSIWTKAAIDYIELVSEKNGCNFYTFKWVGSYCTQSDSGVTGLFKGNQDLLQLIKEANLQSELTKLGSHPTEKIIQFALDILVRELDEIGYK